MTDFNPSEQIIDFNRKLDRIIHERQNIDQPISRENQQLMELARQLLEDDPDPQRQIEDRTWLLIQSRFNGHSQSFQSSRKDRLLTTISTFRQTSRLALSVLLTGVLLVLLLFTPLGTRAQEWIHKIDNLLFTHDPTFAEQFEESLTSGAPTATTDPQAVPVPWSANQSLTVDEAAELVDFAVCQPGYIPEGFHFSIRNVALPDQANPVASVTTVYLRDSSSTQNFVIIQRSMQESLSGEMPIGDAQVTDVTVRGISGLWIEDLRLSTFVTEDNRVDPQYADLLIWEKNGFDFLIQTTADLPLETVLEIADSLH
jgi:hypothetical protein